MDAVAEADGERLSRSSARHRIEFCGTLTSDGGVPYLYIGEFGAAGDAAEHETASAHVATADEFGGEEQAVFHDLEQGLSVFCARDAAEEDELGFGMGAFGKLGRGLDERLAIGGAGFIDGNFAGLLEHSDCHDGFGRDEAEAWDDDLGGSKGSGVGELASEVEAAEERIDLADRCCTFAETDGEVELGCFAEEEVCANAAELRGREKEDTIGTAH